MLRSVCACAVPLLSDFCGCCQAWAPVPAWASGAGSLEGLITDCSRSGGHLTLLNTLAELPTDAWSEAGPHTHKSTARIKDIGIDLLLFYILPWAEYYANMFLSVCVALCRNLPAQQEHFKLFPIIINLFQLILRIKPFFLTRRSSSLSTSSWKKYFFIENSLTVFLLHWKLWLPDVVRKSFFHFKSWLQTKLFFIRHHSETIIQEKIMETI